jgi:hypothetical protein
MSKIMMLDFCDLHAKIKHFAIQNNLSSNLLIRGLAAAQTLGSRKNASSHLD